MNNPTRYDRQVILPELGPEGQRKLGEARVLVVGAGGLGCPVLQYLAAAGTGTLGIVDHDSVDVSNLHRQTLYTTEDQGKAKARVAKARLLQLNPDISISTHEEELTDLNVLGIFSGYDIIVDGTDNFAAKFLINDAAVKTGKAVVYGALQGFEGQVSVFDARRGPCYRCLHPHPPKCAVLNCAEAGVIGAIAGIVGAAQAMEAIKLIVGGSSFEPLIGKLLIIEAHTMDVRTINIPKRGDCPTCSKSAPEILLYSSSIVCFAAEPKEMDCSSAARLKNVVLIDVRELHEWEAGHITGAAHIPLSILQENLNAFPKPADDKICILYCQRGSRSKKAAELLLAAGFKEIVSLQGGYEAWQVSQKC